MKVLNERLYIEFNDAIEAGISSNTILRAKDRSKDKPSTMWVFQEDPNDRRKILIDYEVMKDCYKNAILQRFGNPYEVLSKEPLRKMVSRDMDAERFFLGYEYDGGKKLPVKDGYNIVRKYTIAASWLNMLCKAKENTKDIKRLLNITVTEFWVKIAELIKDSKKKNDDDTYISHDNIIDLPTDYKRLNQRIDEYAEKLKESKEAAYLTCIHKQFGNDKAKKIKTDEAESQLFTIVNNATQPDDVLSAYIYNKWAIANGQDQISPATVGNFRRKNLANLIAGREGNSAFNEKFIRQVSGYRPTQPLYLVEHDDNNLDFLYINNQNDKISKYVAIVVTDSYCDLVLGKSIIMSKKPMIEQVHAAYLEAMYYIKHLTGGWYLPFELKSDKYAIASLKPYYEKIARFTPPATGNKHRGYIEQFFGSPLWKRSQKLVSEGNWSGNNMTAKFRGVNQDVLKCNQQRRNLPYIGEQAELQIEKFFHLLRHMPDFKREQMNAPSKEQKWLQAWNELPEDQKRPITDEQFLMLFGIPGNTVTITNAGVFTQIDNKKYKYDLPEQCNGLIGEEVTICYDPFDMSRVLCTNGKNIRFIAKSKILIPRATKDHYKGSRTYLNAVLSSKVQQVRETSAVSDTHRKNSDDLFYNAEAVLQAGIILKDEKNEAEHQLLEDFSQQHEKFMDDNNDLSQFFQQ